MTSLTVVNPYIIRKEGAVDLPIVDFEHRVEAGYWQTGNEILPKNTAPRVEQLLRYQRLWNGDFTGFLTADEVVVKDNYFRMTAVFLAELIMASPPEIEYEPRPVSGRFMGSLVEALYDAIVDYSRYGTALFRIREGRFGWHVTTPQPIHWFPVDEWESALLWQYSEQGKTYIELFEDFALGQSSLSKFEAKDGKLGAAVGSEDMNYGDDAGWQVVADETLGRAGMLVNVPRRPSTGDWGLSLYQDMATLVFELTRVTSQTSYALREGGNTKLKAIRDDDSTGWTGNFGSISQAPGAEMQTNAVKMTKYYDEITRRNSILVTPPAGYKDVAPLHMMQDLKPHMAQAHLIQEQIFAHSNVPGVLYLLGGGHAPISGASVEQQYKRTLAYIRSTITTFRKAIRKLLLIGAVVNGTPAAQVRDYAEQLEIRWPNLLEEGAVTERDEEIVDEDDDGSIPDADDADDDGGSAS